MHRLDWQVAAAEPRCLLGENPVWSVREQALYWVDIRAQALHRLAWPAGAVRTWNFAEPVAGVALASEGAVVLAMKASIARFDPCSGRIAPLLTVETGLPENRLNEFKCDPAGRLWCGSMWDYGAQVRGSLYRIGPDLAVQVLRSGIGIPNGLAFSQDRVYFADTQRGDIEVAEFTADESVPSWRTFSPAGAVAGRPDGCALDAQGHLWTTRPRGGCVARIAPDGTVAAVYELPVSHPSACAFGGPELDMLFVTTARQKLAPEELARQPLAGCVLQARVGVRGRPEPEFQLARG